MEDVARVGAGTNMAGELSPHARLRGRYPRYTRDRLADFSRRLRRAIYPDQAPASAIEIAGPTDRIGLDEARGLDYRPAAIGEPLGPLWSTYWFRVTCRGSGRLGRRAGRSLLGLSRPRLCCGWTAARPAASISAGTRSRSSTRRTGGERVTFHVEVACNRSFGRDEGGVRGGDRTDPYRLIACEHPPFRPRGLAALPRLRNAPPAGGRPHPAPEAQLDWRRRASHRPPGAGHHLGRTAAPRPQPRLQSPRPRGGVHLARVRGRSSGGSSRWGTAMSVTSSRPSATPISTPPGCGRSRRPGASASAPSPPPSP